MNKKIFLSVLLLITSGFLNAADEHAAGARITHQEAMGIFMGFDDSEDELDNALEEQLLPEASGEQSLPETQLVFEIIIFPEAEPIIVEHHIEVEKKQISEASEIGR